MDELLASVGKKHPRVLIAGGAGYLGARLAEKLLSYGFAVVVLDNLSSPEGPGFQELKAEKRFEFFRVDINDGLPAELSDLDFVFHLARLEAHEREAKSSGLSSLLTNAVGTQNILELTRRNRARFLFASSIDVYRMTGETPESPAQSGGVTSEEEKLYSLTQAKRFAETLVWEYAKKFDLNARVVRLANIYGPGVGLGFSGTLGRLLEQLLNGEDLVVYGEGLDKEYYLYIDDAVTGLLAACFAPRTTGMVLPLSPTKPVTTLELAYLVREAAVNRTKVIFHAGLSTLDLPAVDIPEEFQTLIGWRSQTTLKAGVGLTLKHYRENRALTRLSTPPAAAKTEKVAAKIGPGEEGEEKEKKASTKKKAALRQFALPSLPLSALAVRGRAWLAKAAGLLPQKITGTPVRSFLARRARPLVIISSVLLLLTLLGQPLISFWLSSQRGERQLLAAEVPLLALDSASATGLAEKAELALSKSGERLRGLFWVFTIVYGRPRAAELAGEIRAKTYFAQSLGQLSRAVSPLEEIIVFGQSGVNIALAQEDTTLALGNLNQARNLLLMGQAELPTKTDVWQSFLLRNKSRVALLEALLSSPEKLSDPATLRRELEGQGFYYGGD